MALLNTSQLAKIRGAIQAVTDQFFVTPITYKQTVGIEGVWNEDNPKEVVTHVLQGLAEYPTGEITKSVDGSNDFFDIEVSLNVTDLEALNLWDSVNNVASFVTSASSDRMTVKGVEYKVTFIGYDGPLEDKPVLVLLKGEVMAK